MSLLQINTIPKIIYTTWISDKEFPKKYQAYFDGWKKLMPDYEIIIIDKENVIKSPFVQKAIEIGNYTLAGHYGRCERLYETGGLYFDIDVEVIKSFDPLLTLLGETMFLGREDEISINNAVIGCLPKQQFMKDCLEYMDNISFDTPKIELETGPRMFAKLYEKHKDTTLIYPEEYFYPYHYTQEFNPKCITKNTYSIHHWGYTWNNEVSIVIPCYNQAQYLGDAISSALNQTVQPYEIIVVNDGSPDNTNEVASRFPVKLINQRNRGLSGARNAGIAMAKGKYIICLDSDDKLHPQFIEKLKGLDDIVCPTLKEFGDSECVWTPPREHPVYTDFLSDNQIFCSAMFKREIWEKIGGFDENMREGYEDWDFWTRATKAGYKVTTIKDILFYYRKHGRSMVNEAREKHNKIREYMINKYKTL